MSTNPLPDISAADQGFARIWAGSTAHVLEQLAGSPFTSMPHSPASTDKPSSDSLWACFKTSGCLTGDLAFLIARPDAVRLTQLFMSELLDSSAVFDEGRADALNEILRQIAGIASTTCKSKFGGEVQFTLEATTSPEWQTAGHLPWVFTAPKIDPFQWTLAISPELQLALAASPSAGKVTQASAGVASTEQAQSTPDVSEASAPANLDLLLDVELEASLRFGQREMFLRDILELHPGSVVELDRRVQEPAELMVSGRVIAHGEVVIVDGNYGLRITDIAQANQRLQSLET